MSNEVQCNLLIGGKVQGVWYRVSCQKEAQRLGVTGWVKNKSSGQVEALIQGKKEAIDQLIEWCRVGPLNADVDDVEIKWIDECEIFENFTVK